MHLMRVLVVALCSSLLMSCATRSISDSGYRRGYNDSGNRLYRGEISELDVLGSSQGQTSLETDGPANLRRGDRLLVIQSGALLPDEPMLKELDRYFEVAPFSGIPSTDYQSALAERLRAAALRGGYTRILVYWGVLESGRRDEATKIVSWVPVAGWVIPDRTQQMRIRLKGFLMDAMSGQWKMVLADSFEDERISAPLIRERSDQGQVMRLKALAYHNLVAKLW